ncbi:hypothetical protein DDQ41_14165 [Streptomyces spongiicola]|uniref:Uncharacterized protein n=1 Tax=Streptomyces spongiicola TaxID=1690221 RepID=A0ABM6V6V8_9ACTN|nr:hypothetical protein DDQ41_14165 [Streptomyces spongiicola]
MPVRRNGGDRGSGIGDQGSGIRDQGSGIRDRRLVRPQERVGVKGDGPERGRVTEAAGAELPCHFGSRRGTIAPKAVSY